MTFGVLCNGNIFQHWQLEAIRKLVEGGHPCKLLIVNANKVPLPGLKEKLVHYPYSKFLYRAWFRYMMKPEAKKNVNINDYYVDIPQISCTTTKKGYAEYFGSDDVSQIKSYNLDFILRFGFGIIKNEILDAAKYGVWSYHHDDDRKYRGVPTGFWEIMFNDPVNAAILQRLTNKLDSGIILHKAYFATINHSWEANLNHLFLSSTEWPLQVCRDIENGNAAFLSVSNSPESALYKLPNNGKMLRFLLKVAENKIKFHLKQLFLTENWEIGIVPLEIEQLMHGVLTEIPKVKWLNISNKRSVYYADPFGFLKDDTYHILCEEYSYRTGKGIVVSMQVDSNSYQIKNKTIALEKDYHLAFPYLFEWENKFYCIPENSADGKLDLYLYHISSGKLIFERTLIDKLKAVDPVLFFYEGYWWLFFTDVVSTNERLHIWYSKDLKGPYMPHGNNPVKVDIRSSRPAGNLFVYEGKLYRPAQDCSIRSGRRICLNRVEKLSTTEFCEIEDTVLNPATTSAYKDGMHTFSMTNSAGATSIIVDGKRECFIWQAFTKSLLLKIKKVMNTA